MRSKQVFKQITKVFNKIPQDFGGGCSLLKARLFAQLIIDNNLKCSIDIGVYKGRSLFPQAFAHKLTNGIVYGIDPYTTTDAQQYDREDIKDKLLEFVSNTNFQKIFEELNKNIIYYNVESTISLIRKTSDKAISYFLDNNITVDLIHIDGNHDLMQVTTDYQNYLPILKKGSFLILDDISWETIKPIYLKAKSELTKIYEKVDYQNDFAVFYNGPNNFKTRLLKAKYYLKTLAY